MRQSPSLLSTMMCFLLFICAIAVDRVTAPTTFVTAMYDIGRKNISYTPRSYEFYLEKFAMLLKSPTPMVIFG